MKPRTSSSAYQGKRGSWPLHGQTPGGLTRWMAVPWQGDTVFCRSGYDPEFDPFVPTFWPARVPNHVLTQDEYAIVMNESLPRAQRLEAFSQRRHWVRFMQGGAPQLNTSEPTSADVPIPEAEDDDPTAQAGWESDAQLEEFRRILGLE